MTELRRRVEALETAIRSSLHSGAAANVLTYFQGSANLLAGTGITLTPGPGTLTIDASGGGGSQAAIQFEDEGVALGAPGTVDTVDFVGAGVTATRVGDAVTVTIPGGGSGTVTSVGLTVPAFLSVAGSPVTTSGVLAVTLSGTALPIANGGTGQTSAQLAINALSQVSGATNEYVLTKDTGTGNAVYKPPVSAPTDGALTIQFGPPPPTASAILATQVYPFLIPADYTLTGWAIACDPSATVSVDVWYSTFPTMPVIGDSITSGSPIACAGTDNTGTVAGWTTTAIARGNWIAFAITANDVATFISVQLQGDKS